MPGTILTWPTVLTADALPSYGPGGPLRRRSGPCARAGLPRGVGRQRVQGSRERVRVTSAVPLGNRRAARGEAAGARPLVPVRGGQRDQLLCHRSVPQASPTPPQGHAGRPDESSHQVAGGEQRKTAADSG